MSSEKSLTPQIRFKGFTEAWEQRKLGDIAAFSKGQGFSKSNLTDSGFPVILYGRLYTNYETQICKVDTFVKSSSCGVLSKGGEVIVPASGETAEDIAVASHVSLPGILLGGDLNVVTPKDNLDSNFLALFITFGNAHVELSKRAQGKSVVHVRNGDLSQLNIKYPTQSEQILISNLFIKNDNLITLHQRKLDALKKIKSALLEKMFPKDGSDIPEIRFAGFTEAWEQRKLGDIAGRITTGKLDANAAIENGKYPFFTTAIQTYRTNTFSFDEDAILVAGNGPIGYIKEYCGKFDAYQREYVITGFLKDEKPFIATAMKSAMPARISSTTYGSAMPYITLNVLTEMNLSFPKMKKERISIAGVLYTFDSLITLHQRKLDALKKIKSALLEKMFV